MNLHRPEDFRLASQDQPVWQYLRALHERYLPDRSGAVANYIPELAAVDPDSFGVAFATTDGFLYEVGDTATPFTIQSVSKAVIYGMALEEHGREEVLRRIGVEPSGEAFNSITFDELHNRPFNPMVNAGAIAATAMIRGASRDERLQRILDSFRRFTGRELEIDDKVFQSESLTGFRNRAIAYLEINAGMIDGDVEAHLELYFIQCSLLVTARDIAVIGASLANGGVNPLTGERAIAAHHARSVLSVMNSCGMYNYAGSWQFDVGLPAKSGVGGGITAVLPGQLGIGVFSPRLDEVGNSARGVKVCVDVSRNFGLHLFEHHSGSLVPFRRVFRGNDVRSKRVRRREEVACLDKVGHKIIVYELQAELRFIEAERVARRVIADRDTADHFILDLTRVVRLDSIAFDLLSNARATLNAEGKELAIVTASPEVPYAFTHGNRFATLDTALEEVEERVLVGAGVNAAAHRVELADFELLQGFSPDAIAQLASYLKAVPFSEGEALIRQNAEAWDLFFLVSGRVDIIVRQGSGGPKLRVGTIDPGNIFGELALFARDPRTADVVGAVAGEVLVLDDRAVADLRFERPELFVALLEAVGRSLAERLRRANREILAISK